LDLSLYGGKDVDGKGKRGEEGRGIEVIYIRLYKLLYFINLCRRILLD
jgi:hypothetical protein